MTASLFTNGYARDQLYLNLRDYDDPPFLVTARNLAESLWVRYERHADSNFLTEIRNDFRARFWEMYLACSLEDIGHSITCCKPGPDILMTSGETRIWIEAVTASGGEAGRPDSIPERRLGEVNDSPEKEILLRIRAAIREKFEYKYQKYVMDGIIDPKDAYVVAVNASKIFYHAIVEMHIPRIVQAVYPVGYLQIKYDRETMKEVDRSYAFRPEIQKVTGESVSTNIFFDEPYRTLSGVLYSCVDATYVPERMGDDFVVVHNLNATVGVPYGLLGRGREYSVVQTEDGFSLNNRNWRDEKIVSRP